MNKKGFMEELAVIIGILGMFGLVALVVYMENQQPQRECDQYALFGYTMKVMPGDFFTNPQCLIMLKDGRFVPLNDIKQTVTMGEAA